jgi:antitoxin (DNA-binding transcriptional repressor) of toxin-antitoxin stability system
LPDPVDLTGLVIMSGTAAVAELKAHLSRFLRRVKAGHQAGHRQRPAAGQRAAGERQPGDGGVAVQRRRAAIADDGHA